MSTRVQWRPWSVERRTACSNVTRRRASSNRMRKNAFTSVPSGSTTICAPWRNTACSAGAVLPIVAIGMAGDQVSPPSVERETTTEVMPVRNSVQVAYTSRESNGSAVIVFLSWNSERNVGSCAGERAITTGADHVAPPLVERATTIAFSLTVSVGDERHVVRRAVRAEADPRIGAAFVVAGRARRGAGAAGERNDHLLPRQAAVQS